MSPSISKGMNLVEGEWTSTAKTTDIIDPLTGKAMIQVPDTGANNNAKELEPFIDGLLCTPKHGLHNPIKNKERYLMLGQVMRKTAEILHDPEVMEFFVRCTQRCVPKSYS